MKIGPGRNVNVPCAASKTSPPVMSCGSKSAVNWIRVNESPSAEANDRAIRVLPEAREVLEQNVSVGDEPREELLDDVIAAHDRAARTSPPELGPASSARTWRSHPLLE